MVAKNEPSVSDRSFTRLFPRQPEIHTHPVGPHVSFVHLCKLHVTKIQLPLMWGQPGGGRSRRAKRLYLGPMAARFPRRSQAQRHAHYYLTLTDADDANSQLTLQSSSLCTPFRPLDRRWDVQACHFYSFSSSAIDNLASICARRSLDDKSRNTSLTSYSFSPCRHERTQACPPVCASIHWSANLTADAFQATRRTNPRG